MSATAAIPVRRAGALRRSYGLRVLMLNTWCSTAAYLHNAWRYDETALAWESIADRTIEAYTQAGTLRRAPR